MEVFSLFNKLVLRIFCEGKDIHFRFTSSSESLVSFSELIFELFYFKLPYFNQNILVFLKLEGNVLVFPYE